jgi:hypothetical protein
MLVYVGDMLLAGAPTELDRLAQECLREFEEHDLGPAPYFL